MPARRFAFPPAATTTILVLAAALGGCASGNAGTAALTPTEQWRAELCDQVLGVSRMACIQQTAGRPGSPYDAAGRRVALGGNPSR